MEQKFTKTHEEGLHHHHNMKDDSETQSELNRLILLTNKVTAERSEGVARSNCESANDVNKTIVFTETSE